MNTKKVLLASASMLLLAGCAAGRAGGSPDDGMYNYPPKSVMSQKTPYDRAVSCLSNWIKENRKVPQYTLGVGATRDATGKVNLEDGEGNYVTQGWGDVITSALDQVGVFKLVERQNTQVIEWELAMAQKKRLGDRTNPNPNRPTIDTNGDGHDDAQVPWRAYMAGEFTGSDFIIQGSINTLDLATGSGGARARIYGIGPEARWYEAAVAYDMRLVNTRNTEIPHNVTVKKKILGYEVGAGAGLFLGEVLLDIQAGVKENEPLNFSLREMTKLGVYRLASYLYSVPEDQVQTCRKEFENIEQEVDGDQTAMQVSQAQEPDRQESSLGGNRL